MNDIQQIEQFAIGAVTIAATRKEAVRAEVLKVGDACRVLIKGSYSKPEVHTGVIVGFEPFATRPTIIVAYIEEGYNKADLKMLYFTGNEDEKTEIIAAPEDVNISIERSRVLDTFNAEERKKLAELDEIRAKRQYFNRYFGHLFGDIPAEEKKAVIEGTAQESAE